MFKLELIDYITELGIANYVGIQIKLNQLKIVKIKRNMLYDIIYSERHLFDYGINQMNLKYKDHWWHDLKKFMKLRNKLTKYGQFIPIYYIHKYSEIYGLNRQDFRFSEYIHITKNLCMKKFHKNLAECRFLETLRKIKNQCINKARYFNLKKRLMIR